MRRSITLSLALATALPALAFAQSVTTVPVGFNTATVQPANGSTAKSTVLSVPFYAVAAFQGAIASVDSANQISFTGTTFTTLLTAPPYLARFKTGASVGRFFVITSFTNTQLTLDTDPPSAADNNGAGYTLVTGAPNNTQTQVAVGDAVEILPANTLGSLFGTVPVATGGTMPFLVGSVNVGDNLFVWNKFNQNFDQYFYTSGAWRKSGSGGSFNNAIILPDQGIFILRRGTTALNLTLLGTVPSTDERTDYVGPKSSFVDTRFPVDFTFAGTTNPLNLQTLPSWLAGSVNTSDNVFLWNQGNQNFDQFFFAAGHWRLSGNGNLQDNTVIPLGTAMFILRRSTAAGNQSTLLTARPYSLN